MRNSCFRILTPRMAPTICVAEFPMAGTTVSTLVRRRRGSENGAKRRRLALEEMLRTGTIVETLVPPREHCSRRLDHADTVPNCSVVKADRSEEYPMNVDENYRRHVAERRKDLLSIVIRTIILVRRNRILQRRLNALRAETRRFLSSVLNNPEGQQRRSRVPSHSEDSSPTKKAVSTRDSFHGATYGCDNRDRTSDESSSSDKSEDSDRSEC
ncbi:uncharacterized protein [Temnothorax nylanderi]|uniref:uncharacterized protein isoform X1 n=2 Tax=Temnothorax nylanderi TaxID=102681 RepID=UPI003A882BF6